MRSQEQMIATWESLFSGALRRFRSAVLQLGELPKDYLKKNRKQTGVKSRLLYSS